MARSTSGTQRSFLLSISVILCLSALTFSAFGCRSQKIPGLVRVEGVVLYEGQPLAWASVGFAPEQVDPADGARFATALTDQNGEFQLSTLGIKGALPGDYVVTVEKYIANKENAVEQWSQARQQAGYKEPEPPQTIDVVTAIPLEFSVKKTSPLTATVNAKGKNRFEIDLSGATEQ
ncbi:MAG: carboxypeptidase-like regulatory domain-containing protein [Planctomycetia bacterium]|nr:carboxypeptidase-like regulatory domain-containing protein [Planctomycetia bacterium]